MHLESISVTKYRSIRTAQKLGLGSLTVLVGANNEGKSNLLRAMVAGMTALNSHGRVRHAGFRRWDPARRRGYEVGQYNWSVDFPVDLQEKQPNGKTLIDFEFILNADELRLFRDEFGSSLNGSLPIRVALGRVGPPDFSVRKQRVGQVLSKQSKEIARFVGERLKIEYVHSMRSAETALDVVSAMLDGQLRVLEENARYRRAVELIETLQQPLLQRLSDEIKGMLSEFLPDVNDVTVGISSEERYSALRRIARVVVDDGTPTELHMKGDGVQSLAAISLIRNATLSGPDGPELLLCIEEPEAHLHPNAIHRLKAVLHEIAAKQQVVLTTHSPVLVNRAQIETNILVHGSRATPAKNVQEIREALGVRTADNLRSAEWALVVEGESDRVILKALLSAGDPELGRLLDDGMLAVETLAGGSNLGYRLSSLREALCAYHVFLDNDGEGREAARRAEAEGLLTPADCTFAIIPGQKESELEDLLNANLYREMIRNRYNVEIKVPRSRRISGKWSDRMKLIFELQGQPWDDETAMRVKTDIAQLAIQDTAQALSKGGESVLKALIMTLRRKLITDQ